jgi:hypothetical protein
VPTLTIRLDAKLARVLDRLANRTGRTKSEIAIETLMRRVALARSRTPRKKQVALPGRKRGAAARPGVVSPRRPRK